MANKAIDKAYLLATLKDFYNKILSPFLQSKPAASGGTDLSLVTTGDKYRWDNTTGSGTVTNVATGAGLTGGPVTSTGTIKANLVDETPSSQASETITAAVDRQYAVNLDSNDKLSVNVPWSDTTYSSKAAASGGTDESLVTTGEKYTWNQKVGKSSTAGLLKNDGTVDTTSYAASANAYVTGDTAETALADSDYFPFYDTSATGKRKTLWSNIKSVLKTYFDTLYSTVKTSETAASGGTTLSLVTTGEKYTWNSKAGTSVVSTSANGLAPKVTNTSNFLKGDGTWATPPDHITTATTSGSGNAVTAISADANGALTVTKGSTFLTSHQTIKQDGITGATINRYGVCSTAAGTAAKAVSITSGTFPTLDANANGTKISVKFTNANTAGTPTLNVNSKGAKNVYHKGAQITTGDNKALLAGVCDFIYDNDTGWHLVGNYIDTNTHTITGVKGDSESSYRTGNVNLTAANIGAATSGHTHTASIAADSGTSALTMAANTKYKLTAGGSTFIFTTPPDGNTNNRRAFYGTCSTAAEDQVKVVTLSNTSGWELAAGVIVGVKFTNTNTYSSTATDPCKLNVNSTGDKNIYYANSATPTGTNTVAFGKASYINYYMYDGTNWVWLSCSNDNNTTYSAMSQSEANTGTATTQRTITAAVLATTISNKIGALDGAITGSAGAGKTLTAFSQTDGKVTATFGDISITKSQVSDFPTSMTPTSHTHGNIQNGGTLQTTDIAIASGDKLVVTDSSDSSKVARTSISFDGSTTTQALSKKGTWVTYLTSHQTIKQDGVTGATVNRFGTCSTAAGTAAKTVDITTGTFALEAGATVAVKFTNKNTASSPTLAVGSTAAKNIFVNGAQITTGGNKAMLAGTVVFIYDGTQYNLIGNYYDTNTQTVTGVKGNSETDYRTGNVNITAANIGAATSGHTHTLSLAADSGTSALTMAANTKYKLTAGGSSFIFTTPADNNSDTKVKQDEFSSTATGKYNILLGYSTQSTTSETQTVHKKSGFWYDIVKGSLSLTQINYQNFSCIDSTWFRPDQIDGQAVASGATDPYLPVGTTSVRFKIDPTSYQYTSGAGYCRFAYEPYIEVNPTATAPSVTEMKFSTVNDINYCTVKFTAITSTQAGGDAGQQCHIRLRRLGGGLLSSTTYPYS